MTSNSLIRLIETISVPVFKVIAEKHKGNIHAILKELIDNGLDNQTDGFWVLDIPGQVELYSPKFRNSLGYKDEQDFPSTPASWQNAIEKESLDLAVLNYEEHIRTRGTAPYTQAVTYNKKRGGKLRVSCHGSVLLWDNDKPLVMVGVHLKLD